MSSVASILTGTPAVLDPNLYTGGGGGGVTSIVAGTNVTITPTSGLGAVTINASGGGGGGVSSIIAGSGITVSGTTNVTVSATTSVNTLANVDGTILVDNLGGAVDISVPSGIFLPVSTVPPVGLSALWTTPYPTSASSGVESSVSYTLVNTGNYLVTYTFGFNINNTTEDVVIPANSFITAGLVDISGVLTILSACNIVPLSMAVSPTGSDYGLRGVDVFYNSTPGRIVNPMRYVVTPSGATIKLGMATSSVVIDIYPLC